ncbi:predicted protein [Chaetoceros tenuissimus]|uniref:Uncharacterized protein n=1 Tax=Chaetoceros tenuissimus TaxID=426638 RepID=A0AAD3CW57_9STRA|nr:predicted protein [Chaetoceros tenuissimus]
MEEPLIELTDIQDRHSGYPISTPVYIVEESKIKAAGIVVKNLVHYGPPARLSSRVETESGVIVVVREKLRFRHGCSVEFNIPGSEQKANGTIIGFSDVPRKKDVFFYSIVCQIDGKEKIFHNVEPCNVKHLLEEEAEAASVPREVVLEKENTDVSVMPSLEGQARRISQLLPSIPIKKEAVEEKIVDDDESDSSSIVEIDEETAFRLTQQEEALSHQDGSVNQVNGNKMNEQRKNDGDPVMKNCNSQVEGQVPHPKSKDMIRDVNEIQNKRPLGESLSKVKIKNEPPPTEGSISESTKKHRHKSITERNPVASTPTPISNTTNSGAATTNTTVEKQDIGKVTTQNEDISTKPQSRDSSAKKNVDEKKGGKGDPRMTKAFGICIKNPSIPRIDALMQGGFEFLQYDPNKKVPMKNIVDKDGVTLSRRMKTLNVRLCLHKKKQNKDNDLRQNSSNKEDNKDFPTPTAQNLERPQSNVNNQAPALEEQKANSSTYKSSKTAVIRQVLVDQKQEGAEKDSASVQSKSELGKRKPDKSTPSASIVQRILKKQTREETEKDSASVQSKSELGKRKPDKSTPSASIVQRIPKKPKPSSTATPESTTKDKDRIAQLKKEKSNSSINSSHTTKRKPLNLSRIMQTMKVNQGEKVEKPPSKKPTDTSIKSSSSMTSHAFSTADNPIDLTDDHSDEERLSPLRQIKRRKRSSEHSSLVVSMIDTWKFAKPVPSHRTQKEFQGETYYWCRKCNRQQGMWALHHEEDHRTDNHQDRREHWTVRPPKKGEPVVKNVRGTKFAYCNLCRNGKGQWTSLHLEGKHWKLVPPKDGEGTVKVVHGDTFYWCKHCLNGDGRWTRHKSIEHGNSSKHTSIGGVVLNPNSKCWNEFRQFIDKSGNIFPEILANKNSAPGSCHDQSISVCLQYHIKGQCITRCTRAADHNTLPVVLADNLKSWCQDVLNRSRNTNNGKQSIPSPTKMIPRGSPNKNSPLSQTIVAYKGTLTFDKIKEELGHRYLIGVRGSISQSLSKETGCSLYHFCGIGKESCQVILAHRTENGLEEAAKVIIGRLRNNISNSLLPSPRDIKIEPLTRQAENTLHKKLVCRR